MANLGFTYKGGAFSGLGMVHQGSRVGSLRRIDQISRVQGERCPRPLLTSTTIGQGSDKSAEKRYEETWVTTGVNHGEHETRNHSSDLPLEQDETVVHNTTRVTPMYGVPTSNTSATMHKQDMHECTSYTSFHCCQHIGQPFSYFQHIVLSLQLVDTIRLCSGQCTCRKID